MVLFPPLFGDCNLYIKWEKGQELIVGCVYGQGSQTWGCFDRLVTGHVSVQVRGKISNRGLLFLSCKWECSLSCMGKGRGDVSQGSGFGRQGAGCFNASRQAWDGVVKGLCK